VISVSLASSRSHPSPVLLPCCYHKAKRLFRCRWPSRIFTRRSLPPLRGSRRRAGRLRPSWCPGASVCRCYGFLRCASSARSMVRYR